MIIIKVKNYIDRFIKKCLKENIDLYNINYKDNYVLIKINESDYEKVKKLNYYSDIKIIKVLGLKGFLLNVKKYLFDYLMIFLFIILIYLISNVIIKVEIKHENKALRESVNNIIEKYGIKEFVVGKNLGELNEISDDILKNNRDILDWISINKVGMKYIVSLEERILTEKKVNNKYCHIIAKKDGVIKKIISSSGVNMFENGDYIKKGDIIISGSIMLNEENKDNICADGIVIAETWYKVNIAYPLLYEEKTYTKSNRINFYLNGNYLFKKNYNNYDEYIVWKFKNFKILKQQEYIKKDKKYSVSEAKDKAITKAIDKLLEKIGKNNKIIDKKVLKEDANNSKIELELFISVEEEIGKQELFEVGDIDDTKQSLRYTN